MAIAFLLARRERFSRLHGDTQSVSGFVREVVENGEMNDRHGRWRRDGSLTGEGGCFSRPGTERQKTASERNFSLLAEGGEP